MKVEKHELAERMVRLGYTQHFIQEYCQIAMSKVREIVKSKDALTAEDQKSHEASAASE